jgi:serine/threonine protein kinase
LGISLNKDYFHAERIANHVHLFRSALFFRHGVLLPFHRHQEVGTTEDYAPRDELDEMRLRVRSLSRHRRAYTIDRMVALKLDSASTEMDNVNFNSSIVPVNINSIFHDFRVIGQGAFGEVYSARTKSACALGVAEVAIKRIGLDQPLRGLKREIRVLQLCAHPNVIRLLKTYVWENHMWVVMEFCKGGTIEQLRDAHDMSPAAVSYIARELLKALRFIHDSQRIVHRDMKPENVFVTLQGEVKLGDFGFSMDTSYSTRHDRNSVAGTARYLAPEMLCKRGYASKLDIWSFGCTLLYLVTGSDLHSDLASMEAMLRVGSEGVPKVRLNAYRKSPSRQGSRAARRVSYSDRKNSPQRNSSRRMWDPAAKDFIEHCLAYDPRERWSAAQLLEHPFITQHAAATGKVLHPYLRNKILENSLDGMV